MSVSGAFFPLLKTQKKNYHLASPIKSDTGHETQKKAKKNPSKKVAGIEIFFYLCTNNSGIKPNTE